MKRILICAPLVRELKYVLNNFSAEKKRWKSTGIISAKTENGEVILLRTGVGVRDSESSLTSLLGELRPDLIVSLGFAGALYEGLAAGDLVWASRVFFLADGTADAEIPEIPLSESKGMADRLAGIIPIREGCIVTLESLVKKPEIKRRLPAEIPFPVCDMETFVLARTAIQQGIPFFAARSVSDTSEHEIPSELLDIFDESGKILYLRLSKRILQKTGLVTDMVRLRRDSKKAARSLGSLVRALLIIGEKQPV